jgi:thioredoxin reductase
MARSTVDVLIIGAGPAGLSASLTLARQLRTAIVFSTERFRNQRSRHMHMMPTWDHQDPAAFRAATRTEISSRYGDLITFADVSIAWIEKHSDASFTVTDFTGATYAGRKLLLAHGVVDQMPEDVLPGYTQAWGRGIFHCLFCHGYEERGAPSAGVLAMGMVTAAHAVHVSRMARNLVAPRGSSGGRVVIYTNGDADVAAQVEAAAPGPRISVDGRRIVRLQKLPDKADIELFFDDGTSKVEGFLAHMPTPRLAAPFAKQLGCELLPNGGLKVAAPFPETTVKGVFAVGDIATPAPAVAAAIASGAMGAVGIVGQIAAEVTE